MAKGTFNFPDAIMNLSKADIPLDGCTAYMVQGENEQVLFMQFEKDVELPEHSHDAQWGVVLSGRIELEIEGKKQVFVKGDNYYIASGKRHKGKIFAGYTDITFFNQRDRYNKK